MIRLTLRKWVNSVSMVIPSKKILQNAILSPIWTILRRRNERKNWKSGLKKRFYDVVSDNKPKQISPTCRWVLTGKEGRKKARFVPRGFPATDMPSLVEDSRRTIPKNRSGSFSRFVLRIKALKCLDVRTTFLQELPLNRQVFLKPPEDAPDMAGKLWKLKKCVYGLVDATRHW